MIDCSRFCHVFNNIIFARYYIRQLYYIVDECQNLNFHELDTIMTRVGQDSKIIFSGDFFQSDLTKNVDKDGMPRFMDIIAEMDEFASVEFNIGDIVRLVWYEVI